MPIKNTDIVLFQAQDNTDNDNGGGRRTATPVADGAVNNLFPDISRVDTVAGDVALRKVFPVVNTDDRDIYYGAHAIVRKVPNDPRVSSLLFYSNDAADTRDSAQSDIESYLIPSYQAPFYLYGSNIEGAKAVTFLQRVQEPIPDVGDVYVLQEGGNVQYIRVTDVNTNEILVFFNGVDYQRRRVIITTDQALRFTFTGSSFEPKGQQAGTCDTFATQVADAAKFYGNKGLTEDALTGESSLQLESIYEQLVPATTQQTPIINNQALRNGQFIIGDTSGDTVSFNVYIPSQSSVADFGAPIVPGSISGGGYTDDGVGVLTNSGGVEVLVDYETGVFTKPTSGGVNFTVNLELGTLLQSLVHHSIGTKITTENQGTVFIKNVAPVPDFSNVYIDYRSNRKWYRINSLSDGTIGTDDGLGAGLVTDNGDGTATISVTLGAVPDLNSTVIFSWGSTDEINSVRQEALNNLTATFEWKLPHENIDPDNCVIQFAYGSPATLQTLTFSSGNLTITNSNLKYTLDPVNGYLYALDDGSSVGGLPGFDYDDSIVNKTYLQLNYMYNNAPSTGQPGERIIINTGTLTVVSPGVFTYDIGSITDVQGLKISLETVRRKAGAWGSDYFTESILISDENGVLRLDGYSSVWGSVTSNGLITITIPTESRKVKSPVTLDSTSFTKYIVSTVPLYEISNFNYIEYSADSVVTFPLSHVGNLPHIGNLYLNYTFPPNIIGNFAFAVYGNNINTVTDRISVIGEDLFQTITGVAVKIGEINRETGIVRIQYWLNRSWNKNTSSFYVKNAQLTNLFVLQNQESSGIRREVFRAGAADLVTSSFILRYSTTNGTFVATSDGNGDFTGTDIDTLTSYVDTTTGAVFVNFTADINPESLRFDAVAQTTLPLDPELLGLNPVRLPIDGRVPIFYPGAFVVIFNEVTTAIVGTPVADDVETLARTGQAYIEVVDVNGQRLAYDQYVADRDAGTVTFTNPLSLIDRQGTALTMPLSIIDRVEDMSLCTDASVTGLISVSSPLSRDYLAGQTRVASALVWGDIGARTFNLFSQSSFDVWSDDQTQSAIAAQFDDINFPIQINNKDSFTGRWAAVFQNSSTVDIIEETLGVVLSNAPIASDISPINPATGLPYFTIPSGGWGGGWITSNLFRFNTESGAQNMWVIRSVQSGALTEQTDNIEIEIRGDVS